MKCDNCRELHTFVYWATNVNRVHCDKLNEFKREIERKRKKSESNIEKPKDREYLL